LPLDHELSTPAARRAAVDLVVQRAKLVPDRELRSGIQELSVTLDVEIPAAAPDQYAPLTWDQARIAERFGLRFGASTVTHPILARTDDAHASYEIKHSWKRLNDELTVPSPVYCYPNGQRGDFGPRAFALCREQGILAGVTAMPGYLNAGVLRSDVESRYQIPRFNAPESTAELIRITSGLEVALSRLRG
jgi:hypothetical protein